MPKCSVVSRVFIYLCSCRYLGIQQVIFPRIWISYIKACLEATSFSILLNGKPSRWFRPSRGVRQGDPLSPYIFILVAQNLTAIMNHAQSLGLIPGYSNLLTHNFNHLMYADDLILITTASRKVARNIVTCLNLYAQLSGQVPNKSKSEVFLPHWFNKWVSTRICSILKFKLGKSPFTYLGVLISPKRLVVAHFDFMVNRLNASVASWGKSKISKAGKSVLINSILMSTPIYYLAVYPIPDNVLNKLSMIARKFLWANYDHGQGMPMVNWDTITLNKSEGGLGIRHLLKVKHSLMNCSAFFRGLCGNANVLKPFLWINCLNPTITSFLHHPWIFDIPIAFKPVFFNMDLPVEDLRISDCLINCNWNVTALNLMFGSNWNSPILSHGKISVDGVSHWVWFPESHGTKLSSSIYKFLSKNPCCGQQWIGWSNIWKLCVAPKTKTFIWLLMHNKIKTYDFMYRLNLGPPDPCVFCGLVLESSDHLFKYCHVSVRVWKTVENLADITVNLLNLVDDGVWLDFSSNGNSLFLASIIAATLWQIWKSRCNLIFRQDSLDISKMANLVILHVKDFAVSSNGHLMRNYMMNNRPYPGALGVFSAAAWNITTGKGGLGFMAINSNVTVCCAGFCPSGLADGVDMNLKALCWALDYIIISRECCSNIFISSEDLWMKICSNEGLISWRQDRSLDCLRRLLLQLNQPRIDAIPHYWNRVAAALAGHGMHASQLSLFHMGLEKPKWLMKLSHQAGFAI
ncbi:uncharacterized protein LOC120279366 [Dioscorea cayenensis subsp. rotundata]|uniref:Uncharacterized protein LOC120279366 n=1 Tax=Dioscorea cayennensis subsp. rotundata TaxID=55577 RepID=A0AB40CSX1_DIOCR|nr:uncharacterized protein LOC120279366 [Dioscorea cayenensis subsp. rotundata]